MELIVELRCNCPVKPFIELAKHVILVYNAVSKPHALDLGGATQALAQVCHFQAALSYPPEQYTLDCKIAILRC